MEATKEKTYWNGQPTPCRLVRVLVGTSPLPTWWCAGLEGTERDAVEVCYGGQTFYLDNEEAPDHQHHVGVGWWKVTEGQGGPDCYHAELPEGTIAVGE